MVAVVLTTGLLKQKFVKVKAYVPLRGKQQGTSAIATKKETFIIEQNTKLSQETETCVNADSDMLKKVKLDLPAVDVTIPGAYQTVASLQKECISFAIRVVENAKPVIQVAYTDFQFIIESNSTVREAHDYAGVTTVDASGSDLSASTAGQDEELPVEAKAVTCQLSVEDTQGQHAKRSVRVQYLLPKEDKKDQC